MKAVVMLCAALACAALASAHPAPAPQKEGSYFTNEAIRQAQNTYLIPKDATIQKVQEGIELAAYENIGANQRIDLTKILGDHVPAEVISNLQSQVDQVGHS